jgi:hypothetical protein
MNTTRPLIALFVIVIAACSWVEAPSPQETVVRKYIQALNDKDISALLSCVDPKQERMFRGTVQLIEKLTGFPVEKLLDIVPGLTQTFRGNLYEDFSISDVRVLRRTLNGDDAELTVALRASFRSGSNIRAEQDVVRFALHEFGDAGWRITGAAPAPAESAETAAPTEPSQPERLPGQ